jgi:hypothetical protein
MEKVFMVLVILMLGFAYIHGINRIDRHQEQLTKKVEACEKSGGVYVDNMRRMRKYTDHEYVCMNKNMFIFPEGERDI